MDKIEERFKDRLLEKPEGAEIREDGNWMVYSPRFLRKERQRIYWITTIMLESKAYDYLPESSEAAAKPAGVSTLVGKKAVNLFSIPYTNALSVPYSSAGLASLAGYTGYLGKSKEKRLVANGKTVFEVTWSISVNTRGLFSKARVEDIQYIRTSWE